MYIYIYIILYIYNSHNNFSNNNIFTFGPPDLKLFGTAPGGVLRTPLPSPHRPHNILVLGPKSDYIPYIASHFWQYHIDIDIEIRSVLWFETVLFLLYVSSYCTFHPAARSILLHVPSCCMFRPTVRFILRYVSSCRLVILSKK